MLHVNIIQKLAETSTEIHENMIDVMKHTNFLHILVQQHGLFIFTEHENEHITNAVRSVDNLLEEITHHLYDIEIQLSDSLKKYEKKDSDMCPPYEKKESVMYKRLEKNDLLEEITLHLCNSLKKCEKKESNTYPLLEKSPKKKSNSLMKRIGLSLLSLCTP